MFAVPGWSVSATNLKTETSRDSKGADKSAEQSDSKKRKRQPGPSRDVNTGNVAELWERVIEGKPGKKVKRDAKRSSKSDKPEKGSQKHGKNTVVSQDVDEDIPQALAGETPSVLAAGDTSKSTKKEKKEKKKKKKDKERKRPESSTNIEDVPKPEIKERPTSSKQQSSAAATTQPAPPKLTPLQASMREKLVSARFRHLNETLYTKPSAEAFELFEESPEMFQEYHEGFRRQVNVWPENPVDGYIADIKLRGQQRNHPSKDRGKNQDKPAAAGSSAGPLLRTNGTCTIADLGCGDGKLSEALQPSKKKLKLDIRSYDLQSPSPLVTRADIANLPLEDGSVNVAVFCLALMGTNWLDFVEEAYRILYWRGELWVAEIKSRFAADGKGGRKGAPVTHSVGNRKKTQSVVGGGVDKKKNKKVQEEAAAAANEAELEVAVDGAAEKGQETDVSAFVEALRKRGFVLQGEPDLSNKMFVKMHFIKGAPAVVGKGAVAVKEPARGGSKKGAVKFIDKSDQGKTDEGGILKPCVYKLR